MLITCLLKWEKLKEGPQLANNHQEIAFTDLKFNTPSGKIELFSPEPFIDMHPDDAATRKINDGDMVKIFNDRGYVKTKAHLDFGIKKSCVAITNGWWIQEGGRQTFCQKEGKQIWGMVLLFMTIWWKL